MSTTIIGIAKEKAKFEQYVTFCDELINEKHVTEKQIADAKVLKSKYQKLVDEKEAALSQYYSIVNKF